MNKDRPRIVERVERDGSPDGARQSRSNAMVAIGAVLLLFTVVSTISTQGETVAGALLVGLLGIGLLVGGLVIRR